MSKTLQELTIKDNFMFSAAMLDPENCRGVLERVLGIPIARVEVSMEKSIVYHPEYKGVRLDVIAKDAENTHFDVEMQVANREIFKRARYYHSQIDMELLESGQEYEELSDCYVIFICDFDPVGAGKYRYTKKDSFAELPEYEYCDGSHTVFLSTKGTNEDEVPEELVKFLKFVGADLAESEKDYGDALVSRLQASVKQIKASREMGSRYMLFEQVLKDEYKAGKAEGKVEAICELLEEIAPVPEALRERIESVKDEEILTEFLKLASKVESIEEFEEKSTEI